MARVNHKALFLQAARVLVPLVTFIRERCDLDDWDEEEAQAVFDVCAQAEELVFCATHCTIGELANGDPLNPDLTSH